jgi:hypothetical protein
VSAGELERLVKLDRLPTSALTIEASQAERAALARRFGLPALHALRAEILLTQREQEIDARGRLVASFEQRCALSDEPFAATLDDAISFRFVPAITIAGEDEEIEFASDGPDEIEYNGAAIDLGEAVAQSFGLALDPYALGPDAEAVRREAGLLDEDSPSGPFADLAALKTRSEEG